MHCIKIQRTVHVLDLIFLFLKLKALFPGVIEYDFFIP